MKNNLTALTVGFIFSVGLAISGMTQLQKIISFLDVGGNWDPALLFVMVAAVSFHFMTFKIIRRQAKPLFSNRWHMPENTLITKNLIFGSTLFGIGWGLGGYCPGPAVVSLASGSERPIIFTAFMLFGMLVFKVLDHKFKFRR